MKKGEQDNNACMANVSRWFVKKRT